ncbi:hypothetical protein [Kangiella taiwanensis]|uniref:Uncharacterized protein n=1 Tax=Kangiella taiwanensis TaxID=1079179 RepID=A0ABP8I6T1_9GAMM|nr:hypothetical protein [Kangiella taiwanensis]
MYIEKISSGERFTFDKVKVWSEESHIDFEKIKSVEKVESTQVEVFFKVKLEEGELFFKAGNKEFSAFYGNYLSFNEKPRNRSGVDDTTKNSGCLVAVIVVVFVLAGFYLGYIINNGDFSKSVNCTEQDAITFARMYVEDNLKSPKSADFPFISEFTVTKVSKCEFMVNSYVDAQNSFGATVRSRFSATVKQGKHRDDWVLVSLQFY